MDYRLIEVDRVLSKEDADAMVGTVVPDLEPNLDEPAVIVDKATGEPVVGYLPMPREQTAQLRRAVLGIKYGTTRRASGTVNLSRTFGMSPRKAYAGRDSCRPSVMAIEQAKEHATLVSMCGYLEDTLREIAPGQWAADRETVSQIDQDWRMGEDTLWTSGVVNKSSTLPYHRDAFNFNTWSAMPVVRRNMAGGYLHMPEFGITVSCRDGYAVYFAGHRWLHGVTPMHTTKKDGYRYSVVYYALRGMKDCFTYAVETARAQTTRTMREEGIAKSVKGEKDFFFKTNRIIDQS